MRGGVAGLILLWALGCARAGQWEPRLRPSSTEQLAGALPSSLSTSMLPGNAVDVLNNGEVFDALEQELRQARVSVHFELFIWRAGAASERILEALKQVVPQGVACRVVVDPLQSPGFDTQVEPRLRALGCAVHLYHPLATTPALRDKLERNHRKIVVVDGRVAITGGFGIWDSWLGDASSPKQWRDVAVRVRGPVVSQFQRTFEEDWRAVAGSGLGPADYPELAKGGEIYASLVSSAGRGRRQADAEKATQLLIWAARSRLWIANSYFVPSDELAGLLVQKVTEGVDVRVLVPGDVHDMPLILAGQRDSYRRLAAGGVKIWEYRPTMLHSKLILVDDRFAFVGSTNFDPLALRCVKEASLLFEDAAVVAQLSRDFEEDLRAAKRVQPGPLSLGPFLARRFLWNFVGGVTCPLQ